MHWLDRFMTGLALLLISTAAVTDETVTDERATVEQFLEEYVPPALEEHGIPGVVVAVVRRQWPAPVLWSHGLADAERGIAMDPQASVVRVGSVSKAVTATLALIAVERGELELHENLIGELDAFPIRPFADDEITAHHLLTFTGGFDERLFGQHFRTPEALPAMEAFLKQYLPPRFARSGQVSSYNDYQTTLLGYVIAKRAGMSFAEYAERRLFRPLGMSRTSFRQAGLPAQVESGLARGHRLENGTFTAYPRDYIATLPAAGLYTTAQDMAAYLSAILGGNPAAGSVLAPDSWNAQIGPAFSHLPELYAWGYGFAQDRRKGFDLWFKDGQASGFHARVIVVPRLELAVFSTINRNIIGPGGHFHSAARFNRDLGDELLARIYSDSASHADVPPPSVGVADPDAYVGTYRNTVQSRHTPERIITMMDDIRVTAEGEGVNIWGGTWHEVRPGLLRWHEGGPNHVGFGDLADGRFRYLFVGRGSYERVPWFGASHHTTWLAGLFAGMPLLGLLAGSIGWWRGKPGSRGASGLLVAHGAVMTVFFAGFVLFFLRTDLQQLFFGIPWTLNLILTLPLVAGLLVLGLAGKVLVGDRAVVRAALSVYVLVSAAGLLWLHYWRLVGPQF